MIDWIIVTFIIIIGSISFAGNQIQNFQSLSGQSADNQMVSSELTTPDFEIQEFTENDAGSGGDAGDSFAFATEITQGDFNGTLTTSDSDYYSFTVFQGVIINVSMTPLNLSLDFDLTLYSPENGYLASNPKGTGLQEMIIYSTSSSGNFKISITTAVEHVGNYSFSLYLTAQNDFNTGGDAGSYNNEATLIGSGNANGTMVDNSDINDFYLISLDKGEIIDIFLNCSSTTDINLHLWDIEGIEIGSSTRLVGFNESMYYAISRSGDYRIQLDFIESTISEIIVYYDLVIKIHTQDDGDSGTDAGNTAETAALLIIPFGKNSEFNGLLVKYGDLSDFYYFIIDKQSIIYLEVDILDNVNFDVKIYNSVKAVIYSSEEELPSANEYILGKPLDNGTYYIEVEFIA
ncbi:MAG: hypothetical protein FK734_12865, partial [Asgard group archaeon]|nr:hypothetical protein [Asgard group archaeon]